MEKKLIKGKELEKYPHRDLNWRSYFSETDSSYVIREFKNPFQGSLDYYRQKFIEEHIAMLVLAELGIAPEGDLFVYPDAIYYRHKHIVLFQMKPEDSVLSDLSKRLDASGIVAPSDLSYTRIGVDVSDGKVKIFRVDDLVTSQLPLEELLVRIKSKVHGFEANEFILMEPSVRAIEDYAEVIDHVRNKSWMSWAETHLDSFLDIATTDLYLQESKNIPFMKRMCRTGGARLRLKAKTS